MLPSVGSRWVGPFTPGSGCLVVRGLWFKMNLDRSVFFLTNAYVYARNFRVLRKTRKEAGVWPDVARPRRYIDRILWRKLIDHSDQVVMFCDKLAAKRYVSERCPDLPVAEVLWVGEDAREIPEHLL